MHIVSGSGVLSPNKPCFIKWLNLWEQLEKWVRFYICHETSQVIFSLSMTASNAGNKQRVNGLSLAKYEISKFPCVKLSVPQMLPLTSTAGFQDFSVSKYTHWPTHSQPCLATVQFSSVTQSCTILCEPMDHSMPGLSVYLQLPEFTQTHVHWVSDTI